MYIYACMCVHVLYIVCMLICRHKIKCAAFQTNKCFLNVQEGLEHTKSAFNTSLFYFSSSCFIMFSKIASYYKITITNTLNVMWVMTNQGEHSIKAIGSPQESYEEAPGQLMPDINGSCPHGSTEPSFVSLKIYI